MKKIVSICLTIVLAIFTFASCANNMPTATNTPEVSATPEISTPPQASPTTALTPAESFVEAVSDDELNEIIKKTTCFWADDYTFNSADEITSKKLFKFFTGAVTKEEMDQWYTKDDGLLYIPVKSIAAVLDQYFENHTFNPEKVFSGIDLYDKENDILIVRSYGGGFSHEYKVEDIRPASDDLVEIDLAFYSLFTPEITEPSYKMRLTIKITDDGYRYVSFIETYHATPPATNKPAVSETPEVTLTPTPSPTADALASAPIIYENVNLGITLEFPADWRDRYDIDEIENSIYIYSKKVREGQGNGGQLFYIVRQTGELITEEDAENLGPNGKILLKGNGYTYIVRWPTDYPVDNDEAFMAEYNELYCKRKDVWQTIKLLGTAIPEASNAGYKVIGTAFFTVEIPDDWDVKVSENTILCWYIYSGDSVIGSFEIISCYSQKIADDETILREYIIDDSDNKKGDVMITLKKNMADHSVMNTVKSSFKIVAVPYIITLQTRAGEYLEQGGEQIFGKIESVEMKTGYPELPKSISIRVMKCVSDDSDEGYHIEDLNKVVNYSIAGTSVDILPLVGPTYNTYGTYETHLIHGYFLKQYPNYKDFCYDFIIDNEGKLRTVLGHYVP